MLRGSWQFLCWYGQRTCLSCFAVSNASVIGPVLASFLFHALQKSPERFKERFAQGKFWIYKKFIYFFHFISNLHGGKSTVIAKVSVQFAGCRVFNSWVHSRLLPSLLLLFYAVCRRVRFEFLLPIRKTPRCRLAGWLAACFYAYPMHVCMPTMSRMRLSVTLTKRMQQLNLLWGACGTVGGDMAVWRCCSCSCWVRAVCKFIADNFLLALFRLWFHCVPLSFVLRVYVCVCVRSF